MNPLPLHHGAIGNGRVLALVGPDTSIDWLCLPRFDSPSVFARLLDQERGGSWAFEGDGTWASTAAYIRNTNVLRTEITTAEGRFEILDFAPRIMHGVRIDAPVEITRLIRPLEGTPRLRVRFDPRPDYARATIEIVASGHGLEVVGGPNRLYLSSNLSPSHIQDGSLVRIDRPVFLSLSAGKPPSVDSSTAAEALARADHPRLAGVGEDHEPAVVCARGGAAIGALPQAARVQRHRRDHRGRDDQHSRSDRLRAHLGLSLLLAARRRVRRRSAAAPEPPVGGRGLRALPARDGRQRSAAADLRDYRQAQSRRRNPAEPARLRRHRPGPHRQRRLLPAAARRRRRDGAVSRDDPHRPARGLGGSVAGAAARAARRGSDRVGAG